MYRMKGIEPSPRLVHSFRYKIRRRPERVLSEIPQAFLSVWHRARIEPHVYQIAFAFHFLAGSGNKENIVHIRTVEIYPVIIFKRHVIRIESSVL